MKKILYVSTSRADYFIIKGLIKRSIKMAELDTCVLPLGFHLVAAQGFGVNDVKQDFIDFVPDFDQTEIEDNLTLVAQKTKALLATFLSSHHEEIDAVVMLGDRYEMLCAALEVVCFKIPLIHLCGGEITRGSLDNKFRYAISQLSDYHFVTCSEHGQRVRRLGIPEDRIRTIGSPSIESLIEAKIFSRSEVHEKLSIKLSRQIVLLTLHPETGADSTKQKELLDIFINIISKTPYQYIITASNSDDGGQALNLEWERLSREIERVTFVRTLGAYYPTIMNYAHVMLGNSSSGIVEAASFGTHVINVGSRQDGRPTSENLIHLKYDEELIIKQLSTLFTKKKNKKANIYYKENGQEEFLAFLQNQKLRTNLDFKDN